MKIGISACLLGENCTYKASNNQLGELNRLTDIEFVPICPEVMGGLSIPRPPAEIISNDPLCVMNNQGVNVTKEYLLGAKTSLKILKDHDVKVALLKHRSPSCGCDGVYDGTFSKKVVEGMGVCAELFNKNGIKTFHEEQLEMFLKYIEKEGK